jgi:hypothetical protein
VIQHILVSRRLATVVERIPSVILIRAFHLLEESVTLSLQAPSP